MDDTKAKVLSRLNAARDDLLETISTLEPAELAQGTTNDGWSVQDVVAHLASAEAGHQQVIRALLDAEDTRVPGFDLNRFNESQVGQRRSATIEELTAELAAARAETLALLDRAGPGDWAKEGYHPGGFDTTVEGAFRVIAIHEKRHTRDIRTALAGI